MKRDMGLIREILLAVESDVNWDHIEGYESELIKYHQALVIEANLADGKVLNNMSNTGQAPSAVFINKLTWQGHEFIDLMRRSDVWSTIQKEFKEESLGTIIKVAKELTEGWAKKKVKELLGNS